MRKEGAECNMCICKEGETLQSPWIDAAAGPPPPPPSPILILPLTDHDYAVNLLTGERILLIYMDDVIIVDENNNVRLATLNPTHQQE